MTPINKRDFFEKFGERVLSPSGRPSVLKSVKPFLWVGSIIGVFPVKNCWSKFPLTMTAKKVSFLYLYSFCLLGYKVTTTIQYWEFLLRFNIAGDRKQILTDYIAGSLGFLFGFCFGNFAHILAIWKLPSFLNVISCLQDYERKYDLEDGGYLSSYAFMPKRFLGTLVSSAIVIYTPVFILYRIILGENKKTVDFDFQVLPGIYTNSIPLICTYTTIGFIFLELGTAFIYFQLLSMNNVLLGRLKGIVEMVEEKNKDAEMATTKIQEWSGVRPKPIQKSWERISNQYMDFLEPFKKYQEFVGPYFTILYASLIITCVCQIYMEMNSAGIKVDHLDTSLKLSVVIAFIRIFGLANAGENFAVRFNRLLKVLLIASVEQNLTGRERQQLKGILKQTTTCKLVLSASGFFTVSRRNVTSIVSVIITYIIVLLQFGSADKKIVNNGVGGSMGYSYGGYGGGGLPMPSSLGIVRPVVWNASDSANNTETDSQYP